MDEANVASAPGKILWLGGYSVLEPGNISMVTTVDAKVTVTARRLPGNSVILDAPQLMMKAEGSLSDSGGLLVNVEKPLLLLKACVGTAASYLAAMGYKPTGMHLVTKNDSPFSYSVDSGKIVKSGLGSSAALSVASIASVFKAHGAAPEKEVVHKLAQISHSLATGKVGSGFDIAAASYGSILYSRYSPELLKGLPSEPSGDEIASLAGRRWDYSIEPFALPRGFGIAFANFTGESMITTQGIGSVASFKKSDPERYWELIKGMERANRDSIEALRRIRKGEEGAEALFTKAFDEGRLLSKELGILSKTPIEPDDCTALIDESRKHGALVSKLPGAGGKDSIAGISASSGNLETLKSFWKHRSGLDFIEIREDPKGLTL